MISRPVALGRAVKVRRAGVLREDGPLGESRSSKPDSSGGGTSSGQSGPKTQNLPYYPLRVEEDSEKRSASSASSAHTNWPADPMRFYGSGQQTSGTLLDLYPAGPVLNIGGAKTLLSWDRLVLCELVED